MADKNDPMEMIKAAQDAAIKAAMEQSQALFGNVPGFQMPEGIADQIRAQMDAVMPDNMADVAASSMSGVDPSVMAQMMQQNMDYARRMAEAASGGTIEDAFTKDFFGGLMEDKGEWEVLAVDPCRLTKEEERLLAYGAPLLVYNGENVNAIESEYDADSVRDILKNWWDVTDKSSALETYKWLMTEGHHAAADEVLAFCLKNGFDCETDEEDETMENVKYIADYMVVRGYCTDKVMVSTAYAWDLVRATNIARWGYLSGYFTMDEMYRLMSEVAETVKKTFSSWEDYGRSFAFGRGIWQGDENDCETAWEVVQALLTNENSPWVRLEW